MEDVVKAVTTSTINNRNCVRWGWVRDGGWCVRILKASVGLQEYSLVHSLEMADRGEVG